jgi:ABC-type nitrate/sulfonate/bicarbonate transport system substrate-binding protein
LARATPSSLRCSRGRIDAGMTTEPTISRLVSSGVGNVLADLRTPASTQAALGGNYPFICLFMKNDYVSSHHDVVQKLVNAYVETLKSRRKYYVMWHASHYDMVRGNNGGAERAF